MGWRPYSKRRSVVLLSIEHVKLSFFGEEMFGVLRLQYGGSQRNNNHDSRLSIAHSYRRRKTRCAGPSPGCRVIVVTS